MLAESVPEGGGLPKLDTAERVSTKIEKIGQRMRNVEEVFSALKENLDQVLGNLQDGILLFTGDGRAVLVSKRLNDFCTSKAITFWVCRPGRFSTIHGAGQDTPRGL